LRENAQLNVRRGKLFVPSPEKEKCIALVLQVTIKVGLKEVAVVRRLAATRVEVQVKEKEMGRLQSMHSSDCTHTLSLS
jgi:hypothetical protein